MDNEKKLFAAFAGATVIGFAYTIRRIIQAEVRHDALCDLIAEQKDKEAQILTDMIFADIVDNYEEE